MVQSDWVLVTLHSDVVCRLSCISIALDLSLPWKNVPEIEETDWSLSMLQTLCTSSYDITSRRQSGMTKILFMVTFLTTVNASGHRIRRRVETTPSQMLGP